MLIVMVHVTQGDLASAIGKTFMEYIFKCHFVILEIIERHFPGGLLGGYYITVPL